jgi:hypothetical protein
MSNRNAKRQVDYRSQRVEAEKERYAFPEDSPVNVGRSTLIVGPRAVYRVHGDEYRTTDLIKNFLNIICVVDTEIKQKLWQRRTKWGQDRVLKLYA